MSFRTEKLRLEKKPGKQKRKARQKIKAELKFKDWALKDKLWPA